MKRSQNTDPEGARVRKRLQPIRNRLASSGNGDSTLVAVPSSKRTGPSASRMSVMPTNQSDNNIKKTETETTNELSLLYHKYLQTKMELLIQNKKAQEREKDALVGLASLANENETCEQKLHEMQTRKIEIIGLNEIQIILDKQISEIKKSLEIYDERMDSILEQLSWLLKDLDRLTCKNLKVPQDDGGELKIFESTLKRTVDIIAVLNQMVRSNSSTMISGGKGLKTFVDTHAKLEKQLKPLECNLRKLQTEILKKTSIDLGDQQFH